MGKYVLAMASAAGFSYPPATGLLNSNSCPPSNPAAMNLPAVEAESQLNIKAIVNEPFRDWGLFFTSKPTVPATPDDAIQRLTGNVRYYLKNYAALFAFVCLIVMMWNLAGLFVIGATFGGIYYIITVRPPITMIGGKEVTRNQLAGVAAAVGSVATWFTGGLTTLLYAVALATLGVLAHAVLFQRQSNQFTETVRKDQAV